MMDDNALFSIGQVASLTGLSPHVIRKWEQRHRVVEPARSSGGDRRYQRDDVDRLRLLKSLVDAGHAIGTLADSSKTHLESMIGDSGPSPMPMTVAVLGELCAPMLTQISGVKMVARNDAAKTDIDILVVEKSSLDQTIFDELRELREQYSVTNIIIVYGFSSTQTAARLSDDITACIRMPVNPREIQRIMRALCRRGRSAATARQQTAHRPNRYSNEVLARIANYSSSIACECPRHLAELIVALGNFETYSSQCASQSPADARLHEMLHQTAAQARESFESALDAIAHHDQIPIDQWQQSDQSK